MQKRWHLIEADEGKVKALSKTLHIHPALLKLLVQRGIYTYDEAKDFFNPDLAKLHNPFLMKDMDAAVHRILKAIERGEKILIYGDYDVDGTTSVATVYLFLKSIYTNIDYYIPNRYTEGYGVSLRGIDYADETACSLIIALDCGVKSNDKVAYATTKNIDFIICDHHLPGDELPTAIAVLDPKRTDCNYPYKELSGCGIGFKLIQAICMQQGLPLSQCYALLDLVCVSIASDIVPITGENRILAFHGLQLLNSESVSHGLKSLKNIAGINKKMDITDVVFVLGPRINAAGRIEDAKHAVKLLIGEADVVDEHAETLHDLNATRKDLDKQITAEALAMIEQDEFMQNAKTSVVFNETWNKGVIGIVASRLTETYYRPTIVLTESDGKVTGSARSVKHFDLYEAIYACREHLIQFGGHKFAAGLTMHKENLDAFKIAFENEVARTISEQHLIPEIEIDCELQPIDITNRFYSTIKRIAPFGPSNMKPVFVLKNQVDSGYSKVLKDTHLKLSLKVSDRNYINGIGFGMADKFALVQHENFDVAFTIEENEWEGKKNLQLMIKDIRKHDPK
jgi:single-stranded-DNA-specific exonuclease